MGPPVNRRDLSLARDVIEPWSRLMLDGFEEGGADGSEEPGQTPTER